MAGDPTLACPSQVPPQSQLLIDRREGPALGGGRSGPDRVRPHPSRRPASVLGPRPSPSLPLGSPDPVGDPASGWAITGSPPLFLLVPLALPSPWSQDAQRLSAVPAQACTGPSAQARSWEQGRPCLGVRGCRRVLVPAVTPSAEPAVAPCQPAAAQTWLPPPSAARRPAASPGRSRAERPGPGPGRLGTGPRAPPAGGSCPAVGWARSARGLTDPVPPGDPFVPGRCAIG